jgi:inosine/xanthosine triphosphatase
MIKIAIGSNRAAKVEAVRAAVQRIAAIDEAWKDAEIIARVVETSAPAMPLSKSELMSGARERALAVKDLLDKESVKANLYVGMEGGFDTVSIDGEEHTFICGWAYSTDGVKGNYGAAPSMRVPDSIARRVIENNLELAQVIDEVSGEEDVRSRQGALGVFSLDLITRPMSFELALIAAFAPFYNAKLYESWIQNSKFKIQKVKN